MTRRRKVDPERLHRFLWKYRNKVNNAVPWTQTHLAEMLELDVTLLNKILRGLAKEGRVYRLPESYTYIVNDPRRYSAEGQSSLPGGKSDV